MGRLLTLLVTMLVAFAAGVAWERRPEVSFTVPIPLWRPKIALPDGLLVQRDKAVAARAAALASQQRCEAALGLQNAAVGRLQDESDRRTVEALAGVREALRGQAAADAKVARLMRPPVGYDLCARYEAADKNVLESLP